MFLRRSSRRYHPSFVSRWRSAPITRETSSLLSITVRWNGGWGACAGGRRFDAISLLHSYANPVHERELFERLKKVVPHVALSHRFNPEVREFESASTTVLSASVMPLVSGYIDRLEASKPRQAVFILPFGSGCARRCGVA